jgi:hypothetical protein
MVLTAELPPPAFDIPSLGTLLLLNYRNEGSPVLVYVDGPLTHRLVDGVDVRPNMLDDAHRM